MLQTLALGGGQVEQAGERARLRLPPTPQRVYADAQLDDYHGLKRRNFPDSPPVRMRVRARASHPNPAGTLGFGFWNDPFSLSGGVLAAPNAVWFFYASPPSDTALAEGVPGRGWKAATLNAGRLHPLILAPAALTAIALTRLPGLGNPVMAAARRAVQAHESLLDDISLTDWHEYELEWHPAEAVFRVDGVERLRSSAPPRGPLGFVAWVDNQYAIASREGKFGFGLCEVREEQWLELEQLAVSSEQ
ncbi:MAG: hypothetical protein ACRDH2_00360 [Anaerolineales bacterium]